MNREELEHAIRAACDVADETELWIFGSQSILGQHPCAPEELRFSMELDVDPKNQATVATAWKHTTWQQAKWQQTAIKIVSSSEHS